MKRGILALAFGLVVTTGGLFLPGTQAEDPAPAVDHWMVGFHEMPLTLSGEYLGQRIVREDEALRFVVVEVRDPSFFVRVQQDKNVRYSEWDDPFFGKAFFTPNDAQYNNAGHWGTKKIKADLAWDRTLGSVSVKVAVIDSGLLKTHEEFAGSGRVLQGYDFDDGDSDPNDNCGHGTHVTGTIGATINNAKGIAGLAQVTILPVKGLDNNLIILCSGGTSQLASALRYARDQGAHFSSNSWGGGSSTGITDAINYAHAGGVTQVAAAGNDGSCTNCVSEPWKSNAAKVIIVSSTTSTDTFSSFSSEGPQVDVAAPGSSIYSSYNGGTSSYSTLSGTSMATPHVTGTLALVKTLNPSFTFNDLDNRIKTTAVDLGAAGFDNRFGYGRINADAATQGGAPPAQCADTLDNDGDTLVDYPADAGCSSSSDDDETNAPPPNNPPVAAYTYTTSALTVNVDSSGSTDSDGTIVSRSWNWGDGTPASSGTTASHTYSAGGTFTVTLTVTDDDGATDTEAKSVTVSSGGDPDPSTPNLSNGVAKSDSISGAGTSKYYKIQVPAGKPSLTVVLDGAACGLLGCNPDLDLYVRRGAKPTDSSYDCRPYEGDSDETCTLANPAADWWYVRVKVYSGSASGSYTIRATY